ncbi:MAG: acyl-CoA dehydrogenase [Deltaproteobacteria bacterium]|nr:acyl-CoA dehydrogenase [Deltaproteobacteria bacterium]
MSNTLVDERDVRFVLYEQLKIETLCQAEKFRDHSKETFDMILDAGGKLAHNDFAPANASGDDIGCEWIDGHVKAPQPFHAPYRKYCEGGWLSLPEAYDIGGQSAPVSLNFACHEMFFAACHSLAGYMGLTHSAAKVIELYGTEEQKQRYLEPLYQGKYGGTMNLTETQAGSDVGAVRTKAIKNPDGTYSIVGGKIFISAGEQDLTENIIHIVLARIEGDPPGTRGLSCFIVPKLSVNTDGTLGKRNDVICAGIEHKMGMKGSATCVLNFGENGKCVGELLGPAQKGIIVMFAMMNEQRALVGLQGLAQASTAYLHALSFARERLQGAMLGSKGLEQVPIIRHPGVHRDLLWMKAFTEGMRALVLYVVYCMDMVEASSDSEEQKQWQFLVEILTPVCKAYCTDRGFEVCIRSIQVLGGYGYCREYKVEQFARDCKVTSIYEGTNAIQAMDLFGRKIRMSKGAAFDLAVKKMKEQAEKAQNIEELKPYALKVNTSIAVLQNITGELLDRLSNGEAFAVFSWATSYLEIFGDVVLGWLLLWQARVACESKSASIDTDEEFYLSKINTAKFYIGTVLPLVAGKTAAIKQNESSFYGMGGAIFCQ